MTAHHAIPQINNDWDWGKHQIRFLIQVFSAFVAQNCFYLWEGTVWVFKINPVNGIPPLLLYPLYLQVQFKAIFSTSATMEAAS